MAVSNLTRVVDAPPSGSYINHPYTCGLSVAGYWYYYTPAAANNAVLGAKIKPYRWGSELQTAESGNTLTMTGTMPLHVASWEGTTRTYHAGTIEWIGPGVNDITATVEDDAFFFPHLGTLAGTLDDDAFYWDRAYLATGSSNWEYYEYHKHIPSFYVQYEQGRTVTSGDGFIVPSDKSFGYLISNKVTVMGVDYSSVMARIHTPSIGGAHNSHNDVNLPSTSNKNYMPGGIVKGNSDRYHAFYYAANGTQWDLYTRTYTDAAKSFSQEVNLGVFDLADANISYSGNLQSNFAIRASAGSVFGPRIYFPAHYANNTYGAVNSITISAGGSGYVNTQVVTFSNGTSNATASITTNATGGITALTITAGGEFPNTSVIRVQVANTTQPSNSTNGNTSSGTGANLQPVLLSTDLKFLSYNSLDTIAGGSQLVFQMPDQTGLLVRPDAQVVTVGSKIYSLITDVKNGGCRLYSYDGTTIFDDGAVVTNANTNYVRVHGFKYNSTDAKFYALLSGTSSGGASTYLGPGMYSFTLTDEFAGYKHLDFDSSTYSFINRAALANGYIQYNQLDATLQRSNNQEPQGIATGTNVLEYTQASPVFFNKKQIDLAEEEYYRGIVLADNRKVLAGRIKNNIDNQGSGDFILSFIGESTSEGTHSSNTYQSHFTWGGAGDDYITGLIQSSSNTKNLWMTGYTKSILVDRKDIKLHGFCRNLNDGSNSVEWVDIATDSNGDIYVAGNHTSNYVVVAKYNANYVLQWQRKFDGGASADVAYGIALDSNNNVYVVGSTANAGAGSTDGLLLKLNSSGVLQFNKAYGTASGEVATSVCVINKSGTEYVIIPVVSGTSTTFMVITTTGTEIDQVVISNLNVNRVRAQQSTPTGGRFLFAGNDGAGGTKAAKFGMCDVNPSNSRLVQWVRTYAGGATPSDAFDIQNIDAANISGAGAGYIVVGSDGTNGLTLKVSVDESAGVYTITKSWARNIANTVLQSLAVTAYGEATRYATAVGYTTASGLADMGMDDCMVVQYNNSGTIQWQNAFGHDADERFVGVVNDITGENVIAAGWSQSHSSGTDAIIFRLPNNGFATGKYHLEENAGQGYFYNKTTLSESANNTSLTTVTDPVDSTGSLATATNNSMTEADTPFQQYTYDGSFGPNGVFMFYLAKVNLEKIQEHLNSTEHRTQENRIITIDNTNSIFDFWQVAVPGDGTADDGNIFGYDIIETTTGAIYCACQTSGDVGKTNLGAAGVYDYLLIEFDPATEQFDYYQNGTSLDEEIYALTELANGKIAYTGRTTGNLGSSNLGGYDIFLGIFDPATETSTYYSTGSGLDDKGVGIHDLGANTLAVVYSSYGQLGSATNFGTEDIGIIKFNYNTNTWGDAYQAGSSTSEIFNQNGNPSAKLGDGRIAIVCHSAGVFADDSRTYGFLDLCLGIVDPSNGTWKKYAIGSGAADFATSAFANGEKLLIAGYSEATFDSPSHGIFVEFDTLSTIAAKSAAAFT